MSDKHGTAVKLVWVEVKRTGARWEMPTTRADELMRWYPGEYALVEPAAAASASAVMPVTEPAPEASPQSAPESTAPARKTRRGAASGAGGATDGPRDA